MRKITAKLRVKVHDLFKNCTKGVLASATCLIIMALSAIPAAWSATPASLTMYVEREQNTQLNNPLATIEMAKDGDTFSGEFKCTATPYGWPTRASLIFKDGDGNFYGNQQQINVGGSISFPKTNWAAPTFLVNPTIGKTYIVTVKLPESGNGTITILESDKPIEFDPQIKSVTMYIEYTMAGFTRAFEVPYNADTEDFSVDFLLMYDVNIWFAANGTDTYKIGQYTGPLDTNSLGGKEWKFIKSGNEKLQSKHDISNYGWRHVALKENPDHSLTAVFSNGSHSERSQPGGMLKVIKADGTTTETPLSYSNMSWSVKNLPLQVGDKPYFAFSDGTYLKYPDSYVFKTQKEQSDMTVIQSGKEGYPTLSATDLKDYPAVTFAGEYTFTYTQNVTNSYNVFALYTTRRDITLENPVMSIYRETDDGKGEFVALMDFVLLDKKAETVANLKAGDKIYLVYGEDSKAVVLDGTNTFVGSHILSDGEASTRLTVDADGTYHLCYDMSDMSNGRKLIIEPKQLPEKLWYVPGTVEHVYTSNMDAAVELLPIDGKPGQYASEKEITLKTGDKFFITWDLQAMRKNTSETVKETTALNFYGTNYSTRALTSKFYPGKDVRMLEFASTGNQGVHYTVPEGNETAKSNTLFVDLSTTSRKTLRWGDPSGYKGEDYWLFGESQEGYLSDGTKVSGVPRDPREEYKYGDKYKFIYHPSTNLYTLTLDQLWGKIRINGKTDDGLYRYSGLKGNDQINHVGNSYDLFYGLNDYGENIEEDYRDDEGNTITGTNRNPFVINDPECAEDIVNMKDGSDGRDIYYYYRNITIVFDPDNNRLWMQSPNRDYVYDPSKDEKDVNIPLYIVFAVKQNKDKEEYRVVKVREMFPAKRIEHPEIAEYNLENDGSSKKMVRKAPAQADATQTGGTTYGYYTTGDFGSYECKYIDDTLEGWCHPETWDKFSDVYVQPVSVNEESYVGEDYNIAYFFFSETDGKAENYDIREMIKKSVYLQCNQDVVTNNNTGYRIGNHKYVATIIDDNKELIVGTENETAPRFFNEDFTSGIEATMQVANEVHPASQDSDDLLGMHLMAIDTSKPFYVELDRSGATPTTRVTRKSSDLYFVSLYRDEDGELHKASHKMINPYPDYPYYYESEVYLPLDEYEWKAVKKDEQGNNIYEASTGKCNFFFSAEDSDDPREVITKSLNASCTFTNPDDQLFTLNYDNFEIDERGVKEVSSNMRPQNHNYPRTFFNQNYEIGSGMALNYFRVVPHDVNHPEDRKLYKVCLWLKGSTRELPKQYLEYLESLEKQKQQQSPRRAASTEITDNNKATNLNDLGTTATPEPLKTGIVQLKSYPKDIMTSIGDTPAGQKSKVKVNGNVITVIGGKNALITDTQGRVLYNGDSYHSIEVIQGIYVVSIDGQVSRIVVH